MSWERSWGLCLVLGRTRSRSRNRGSLGGPRLGKGRARYQTSPAVRVRLVVSCRCSNRRRGTFTNRQNRKRNGDASRLIQLRCFLYRVLSSRKNIGSFSRVVMLICSTSKDHRDPCTAKRTRFDGSGEVAGRTVAD
ncbi:hypothetical protein CC77DRAFT_39067 [Alternaria alternata]|uniref:Uncharacterized protein n=1 Tax=Alternaria alternata TaxID=5599 RepID=A0A177E5R2_ALTAL|nr:hypothetical protein CC77DRAFT_39067 [Alternaria alternata]OAG26339.1 hypothetical protein CC77DRAFT_39067 [Alternaria alternata]